MMGDLRSRDDGYSGTPDHDSSNSAHNKRSRSPFLERPLSSSSSHAVGNRPSVASLLEDSEGDCLEELLDGWQSRNPWSTTQALLDLVQSGKVDLPQDICFAFQRSVDLHERCVNHERVLEVTNQGLSLERDLFLRKLREIEGFGNRSRWGTDLGECEAEAQEKIRDILYEESGPFELVRNETRH